MSQVASRPAIGRDTPRRAQSSLLRLWAMSGRSRSDMAGRAAFFAIVAAVLIGSAAAVVMATTWIDKQFAGFMVNPRMVVSNIGRYDWTGTVVGLWYPEKIVSANGRRVTSMADLDAVVRSVAPGEAITYSVERQGRLIEARVATMRFTWADLVLTFGVMFIAGLLYLFLGVVVFLLKPNTRASWAFLLFCVSLGVYTISAFDVQSTHRLFVRLYFFSLTVIPAAALHLSFVFPERRRWIDRAPALQLAPYAVSLALTVPLQALYPRPAFLIPYQATFAYLVIAAVAVVAASLAAFVGTSSVLARQRAKVVLFGAALGFPIPALAYYLSLFSGAPIQTNYLAIPIVAFPAAIAYALARHNLFDVDVYIKRTLGYALMTAVVGMVYFAMQAGVNRFLVEGPFRGYATWLYPFVLAMLVVFLFDPLNRKTQQVVDRVFFRSASDYKKTISAVSGALTSLLDREEIIGQVLSTIKREMFVETAGIIMRDRHGKSWQAFFLSQDNGVAGSRRNGIEASVLPADDALIGVVNTEGRLVTSYEIEEDPRFEEIRQASLARFDATGTRLGIPLNYQGTVTGVLAVGEKKSGQFFARDEVDLLITMADQAAVAIENATTHEEVVRYAEELATSLRRIQLLESIKTNLSKFVPKTVQDLIEESPEAPSFAKRETDVTVLFADITGYTLLSARMELDDVNRLVERYFGAFLDEILRRGGDVNETAGDGLMVIFQNPDPAHHARAAVQAGLAIRRRAMQINEEDRGQHEPIVMHLGVNSGTAGLGATRIEGAAGTRWTYTASGPTTNIAARLAALSEGGTLIISEETRRRIGESFAVEDLGPQPLKNVATPMHAFRVVSGPEEDSMPHAERRRHVRQPVSWQVRLWVGEEVLTGSVLDASMYGLSIGGLSSAVLAPGQSYRFEVLTDSDTGFSGVGEVRYTMDDGAGIETKDPVPLR